MKAWFPLYPADLLADTTHLSPEEFGVYVRLLCHQWQHGSIPTDPDKLARISGGFQVDFKSILDEFFVDYRGKLINRRMDRERKKAKEISDKRKELGRKGGLAKASHLLEQNGKQKPRQPQPQPQLQEEEENTNNNYRFLGRVIRLTHADYEQWEKSFDRINLAAELAARDAYLASRPEKEKAEWFMSTSAHLRNQNAKAPAPRKRGQVVL